MSLRTKIILLFALLAIAPMLVLAGFSYGYARSVLKGAVQDQLRETAMVAGNGLERTMSEIELRLGTLAASFPMETSSAEGAEDWASKLWHAAGSDSLLSRAAFMGVRYGSAPLRVLAGAIPSEEARCVSGESESIVELSTGTTGPWAFATLTAGFWTADLVTREGRSRAHSVVVVDAEAGTIVYADHCGGVDAGKRLELGSGLARALAVAGDSGGFRFTEGGETRLGAYTRVSTNGWRVTAVSSPEGLLDPLSRMAVGYWVFVLGLGLSTALAFSILIGRFTRSLSELARAAEEIGLGELDPWLPLHTSGELGQLTQAFSGMLVRIRQMMAQVDQSGRLAVVGQLSAYLAHEIRNPLSSIKLNLQRLRRWARTGDIPEFCLEPLEISLREVDRLNASVNGVLQLSRAEDSPREVVSLHDLVEEAADLLAPKFRRQGVGLSLSLDAKADRVLARVGQVKSAVLNLMVNALEAQPNGGRLEIRSELSHLPEMGGPVVALHFQDEGPGISGEIRDRIFEPFFTTKAGGSGIGLAMASQGVKDSGGELQLAPSFFLSRGADFVMVFPLAALEVSGSSSFVLAGSSVGRGRRQQVREGKVPPSVASLPASAAGTGDGAPAGQPEDGVPSHLLTPEGLRAVLALSPSDKEEVN